MDPPGRMTVASLRFTTSALVAWSLAAGAVGFCLFLFAARYRPLAVRARRADELVGVRSAELARTRRRLAELERKLEVALAPAVRAPPPPPSGPPAARALADRLRAAVGRAGGEVTADAGAAVIVLPGRLVLDADGDPTDKGLRALAELAPALVDTRIGLVRVAVVPPPRARRRGRPAPPPWEREAQLGAHVARLLAGRGAPGLRLRVDAAVTQDGAPSAVIVTAIPR